MNNKNKYQKMIPMFLMLSTLKTLILMNTKIAVINIPIFINQ